MKKILFFCFILLSLETIAQDDPIYSHYMFNSIAFNPSYAGNKDRMHLQSTYRMQWVGIEGAPRTLLLNLDAPLFKNLSGGLDLTQDQIGDFSNTKIYGNYAYRFNINSNSRISLGLGTGIEIRQFNFKGDDNIDVAILNSNLNSNQFNVKAGAYYSTNQFYVGISSTSMLVYENIFQSNTKTPSRNYYLTSGYTFRIADNLVLYPSTLIKSDFNKYSSFNFTNLVGYKSIIWTGLSYRNGFDFFSNFNNEFKNPTSKVIGVLFDLELNDQFRIGYNFDYSLSELSNHENGSHEFSLSYYFESKKSTKMLNPRYL